MSVGWKTGTQGGMIPGTFYISESLSLRIRVEELPPSLLRHTTAISRKAFEMDPCLVKALPLNVDHKKYVM